MNPSQGTNEAPAPRQLRKLNDLAIWLTLFVAFALRLYRLSFQSIWWDEGHSLFVASHSLQSIPTIPAMDVHPPLYFWLLHIWIGLAGTSEFALRFLSVIFGVLTVVLMYRIGQRWLGPVGGWVSALLATFSPLYLAYSQEVRMYALVSALSAASVYLFARYIQADAFERRQWAIPYAVITVMGLYSHYFVGFLLIFQNLYWLGALIVGGGWRKGRQWLLWAAGQVLILLLLAPQSYTAAHQVTSYKNTNLIPPGFTEFWISCWRAFTLGFDEWGGQDRVWMLLIVGVLVTGLLARYIPRTDRRVRSGEIGLWLACFVIPLLIYYGVLLDRASFSPRYMMVVTPALYFMLAYAVWQLGHRRVPLGTIALLALLGTFLLADYRYFFDPSTYKDETRELARFLEEEATANDVIFIDVPHPLDYYYRGAAPQRYLFVDIHTVADVLTEACQGRDRLFFVRWRQSDTDPRGAVTFLMDKYGTYRGQKRFRGYDVVWYDLPAQVHFSLPVDLEPVRINFGNRLWLTGQAYGGRRGEETSAQDDVHAHATPSGGIAWVTLEWHLPREACQSDPCLSEDLKAALYLRDARGHQVGQVDKILLNDRHLRTTGWQPDESALNVYTLPVAAGTLPGEYAIHVTIYRAADSSPLTVLDIQGAPLGTAVSLGSLQVVPALIPPDISDLGIRTKVDEPLGPALLFLGYDLPDRIVEAGNTMPLSLYWEALKDIERDYQAQLTLDGGDGTLRVEVSRRPIGGGYGTSDWTAGEVFRDWDDVLIPATVPLGRYHLRLRLGWQDCLPAESGSEEEPAVEISLGEVVIEGRAHEFNMPDISRPLDANFGGKIRLVGYDMQGFTPWVFKVTFYWQALAEMETSYKVFTHLLAGDGRMWGQKDDFPGAGTLPTTGWIAGEFLEDSYEIPVDPAAPPGSYRLEFGFYDPITGVRLPVIDEGGNPLGDHIILPGTEIGR